MTPLDVAALASRLSVYPVCTDAGRRARISDGYHSAADLAAGRAKRQHRGADLMWRRLSPAITLDHFSSRWHYAPRGEWARVVVAAGPGRVVVARSSWAEHGKVTGGAVILSHGALMIGGQSTAVYTGYHHLSRVLVPDGGIVEAGEPIGVMGASPTPATAAWPTPVLGGLVHLHYDLALGPLPPPAVVPGRAYGAGVLRYVDPAAVLARARHLGPEQAWGAVASVGPAEPFSAA